MLKEMLIEPFQDGDWFLGILAWIIFLMLGFLTFILGFYLIDSVAMPRKEGKGVVVNKEFVPAHLQPMVISTGKTTIINNIYIPDAYYLKIRIGDAVDSFGVRHKYYDNTSIGDKLNCVYTEARISDAIYIKEINK